MRCDATGTRICAPTFLLRSLLFLYPPNGLTRARCMNMQERVLWSRTLLGRFFNLLGYVLTGWGLLKVSSTMVAVVLKLDPKKDIVTRGFEVRARSEGACWRIRACALIGCSTLEEEDEPPPPPRFPPNIIRRRSCSFF